MNLFKGGKKEDALREEMSILATSIETINQQLQSGGSGFDDRFRQLLSNIDHKLVQMYEQENKNAQNIVSYMHALVSKEGQKTRDHVTEQAELLNGAMQDRFEKMERLINEQLQTQSLFAKHLQKIDARLKEHAETLSTLQQTSGSGTGISSEQLSRIEKTMQGLETRFATLVELYRKELSIVRDHNQILKKHFDVSFDDDTFDSLVPPKTGAVKR